MRIGFVTDAQVEHLDWAHANGFGSLQWNLFEKSFAAPERDIWRPYTDRFAAEAKSRNLRISAIGALYKNPLDPKQSEYARSVFTRAIDVAAHIGVKTVCGYAGAVIELEENPKGQNPVYKPFENFLPQLLAFWEPLAQYAGGKGVRIAFENGPATSHRLPVMGYNMLAQPAMWERLFNATRCENIGLEWDPSHLICQLIDPVANLQKFGTRVFHVHAKDASMNHTLLAAQGIAHPGVTEHRFPGFGQANWAGIVSTLLRMGYDSDLSIEGWHDPVFRDHAPADPKCPHPLAGQKLERAGLLLAKRWLQQFVPEPAV